MKIFVTKTYVNAHERHTAYNRNKVEALAFLNIIVAIHNSCHHHSYLKFSRVYALLDVTNTRHSSDDVKKMHIF